MFFTVVTEMFLYTLLSFHKPLLKNVLSITFHFRQVTQASLTSECKNMRASAISTTFIWSDTQSPDRDTINTWHVMPAIHATCGLVTR